MTHDAGSGRGQDRWAHLRFAVVGALLAAPPPKGDLHEALTALAQRTWQHPTRGESVRFARSTIERWYYQARNACVDPVGRLRRRVRCDAGAQPSMGDALREAGRTQYDAHRSWSYQLHRDNLCALVDSTPALGPLPSRRHHTPVCSLPKRQTGGLLGAGRRPAPRHARRRRDRIAVALAQRSHAGVGRAGLSSQTAQRNRTDPPRRARDHPIGGMSAASAMSSRRTMSATAKRCRRRCGRSEAAT